MSTHDELAILLQKVIDVLTEKGSFETWEMGNADDPELPFVFDKLTRALALAKELSPTRSATQTQSHRLQ